MNETASKPKTPAKFKLLFFYTYLAVSVVNIVVNTYLPLYFFNFLNVDRGELALILVFSYSALFVKPLISLAFDKETIYSKKRIAIVISALLFVIGFILLVSLASVLIIFGIILAMVFLTSSVIDVIADKILVFDSITEQDKIRNNFMIRFGASIGALLPMVTMMFVFTGHTQVMWNLFFLFAIVFIAPILPISGLAGTPKEVSEQKDPPLLQGPISKKLIGLMCLYSFFIYADQLYQFPFEPWFADKYLEGDLGVFSMVSTILTLVYIISMIIVLVLAKNIKKKSILLLATAISGGLMIIGPYLDLTGAFIILALLQVVSAFIVLLMASIWIDLSKRRVLVFQVIALFPVLAKILFVPLGTYLSAFIPTEVIINLAGICYFIAIFPLILLKE